MRIIPLSNGLSAFNSQKASVGNSKSSGNLTVAGQPSVGMPGTNDSGHWLTVSVRGAGGETIFSDGFEQSTEVGILSQVNSLITKLRNITLNPESEELEATLNELIAVQQATSVPVNRDPEFSTRMVTRNSISGADDQQIESVQVHSDSKNSDLTLQGEVTQAAAAAKLILVGGDGAVATANAAYELSGDGGSITFNITAGESLQEVAERINQQIASTGVAASVNGDRLEFSSTQFGSNSTVRLQPVNDVDDSIEGVNAAQIQAFNVTSQPAGTSELITGTVVSTAEQANLVYQGAADATVTGTATFRLTGTRGSTTINLTEGESLAAVADRINQASTSTGVIATLEGTQLRFTNDTTGAEAVVQVDEVARDEQISITGLQDTQVSNFAVSAIEPGSEHVLSGQVLQSATRASVTLQGAYDGTVIDSANFELTGSLGTANVSIQQGESLNEVAVRINSLAETTGVTASAEGGQLILQSTEVGSVAEVGVNLLAVTGSTQVTGVNTQQISDFQVDSFTEEAAETLSVRVTKAADIAELIFKGVATRVGTASTFTLSGSRGSVEISTTATQTLASLASQVNLNTATTGVQAVVNGDKIRFRSVDAGSDATVAFQVTSGTFRTTGGNGDGTANGTDAQAIVNGQTITATEGNFFQYSDALGTYSFTTADNFKGIVDTISITSQAGQFNLTGGNGDGTATGLDAVAEINGVQVTGSGNHFVVNDTGGEFEIEFAADFEGAFAPITIRSELADFDIQGGDGNGTDFGADFVATINGVQHTSTTNQVTFEGEHGTYQIEFAAGFQGDFDPITVTKGGGGGLEIIGGDELGRAFGSDTIATINGEELIGNGNQFLLAENGIEVALEFKTGFLGEFDPISVQFRSQVVRTTISTQPILSTQSYSGFANSPRTTTTSARDSFQKLLDEIERLVNSVDITAPPLEAAPLSPAELRTRSQLVSQIFKSLSQYSAISQSPSFNQSQLGVNHNQHLLLDLLA